jgi:hypothetical protein
MNTNASAANPSSSPARTREGSRHADPHTLRREGDRFERMLREKSAQGQDEQDATPAITVPEAAGQAAPPPCPQSSQGRAPAAAPRAGAVALDCATATQAALGSAMQSAAPQPVLSSTSADAHAFQVSIHEPMGLPLELRAVRIPASTPTQAAASWALNFVSSPRDANALARHGSRLDERLRARGIDAAQVWVDRDDRADDHLD